MEYFQERKFAVKVGQSSLNCCLILSVECDFFDGYANWISVFIFNCCCVYFSETAPSDVLEVLDGRYGVYEIVRLGSVRIALYHVVELLMPA